jgi:hypothetical protein
MYLRYRCFLLPLQLPKNLNYRKNQMCHSFPNFHYYLTTLNYPMTPMSHLFHKFRMFLKNRYFHCYQKNPMFLIYLKFPMHR